MKSITGFIARHWQWLLAAMIASFATTAVHAFGFGRWTMKIETAQIDTSAQLARNEADHAEIKTEMKALSVTVTDMNRKLDRFLNGRDDHVVSTAR